MNNEINKKKERYILYGLIFFIATSFICSVIPACLITMHKTMITISLIEQIIGVFLISLYAISGGFYIWQTKIRGIWSLFVRWFGEAAKPGEVIPVTFTSIGLGLIISGLILQLYVNTIS